MKTFKEFLEEARESRRMRVLRTSHYTSRDAKDSILKSGFRESPSSGTYHPEGSKRTVYTTPSGSSVGNDYGYSRVNLRIVNPRTKNTISHKEYSNKKNDLIQNYSGDDLMQRVRELSPILQSKNLIQQGNKVVRVPDAHNAGAKAGKGSYVMVDIDTANKSIDRNNIPRIYPRNKPRRKMIRPKSISSQNKQ